MRVKLKEKDTFFNLPKGYEFTVKSQDDGFYTDNPFYAGYVTNKKGQKFYATFDQDKCEVTEY